MHRNYLRDPAVNADNPKRGLFCGLTGLSITAATCSRFTCR